MLDEVVILGDFGKIISVRGFLKCLKVCVEFVRCYSGDLLAFVVFFLWLPEETH